MKLTDATAVRVGGTAATKVYLGATQVWPAVTSGGSTAATLTIPSGKVASSLTSFPVRVDLAHMPTAWWSDAASDGGNVRVKQAGSVIPFDLVNINTTSKTGELFFKAASLASASANTFTIDKSGSGLLPATDPNGRNAVWSDYAGVFLGGQLVNRAAASGSLAATGTVTTTADGWWDFPGGGSGYLTITPLTKYTQWTTGASVVTDKTTGDQHYVSYGPIGTSNTTVATQVVRNANLSIWNSTDFFLGGPTATIGTRYRTVYTHDSGAAAGRKLYVDGAIGVAGTGAVATRPGGTTVGLYLGTGVQGSVNSLDGRLNYVYIRGGLLSPDWIAAEYASWETPSSFYTVA